MEELKISNLPIRKSPKAIGQLKKLKILDIYECPIIAVPKELSAWMLLEELSLNTMEIEDVNSIDFSKLKKLTRLSLIKLPKLNTFPMNAFNAPTIEMISVRLTAFEGPLPEFKY